MIQMCFISTSQSFSRTSVMSSVLYNLVKNEIKKANEPPKFPLACIYDFSDMFSTLRFFASDKILMRMGEIISLLELIRESVDLDWSKCSFPSKFVHKKSKDPLFFTIPIFPRGQTIQLTGTDVLAVSRTLLAISQNITDAGCKYIAYDLPSIDTKQPDVSVIPPLINSNYILPIIDCNKNDYNEIADEVEEINTYLDVINKVADPDLSVSGVILNHVTERNRVEQWDRKLENTYGFSVIGQIRDDPKFISLSGQYEISTEEDHIKEMKAAPDFENLNSTFEKMFDTKDTYRHIKQNQWENLEDRIYSFFQ